MLLPLAASGGCNGRLIGGGHMKRSIVRAGGHPNDACEVALGSRPLAAIDASLPSRRGPQERTPPA